MTRTRKLIKHSLQYLGVGILILSLVGCSNLFGPRGYSVKRVSDGDTIGVTDPSGNNINVRFACVDAPEIAHTKAEKLSKKAVDKNQFKWGEKAQARLQQLINQGGDRVVLTVVDTDRYGRKVSEVRLPDGTFVQEVLAKEGLVMVYNQYIKNCPSAAVVQQAEALAKKSKRGIWSDSKFLEPWEYRKESK